MISGAWLSSLDPARGRLRLEAELRRAKRVLLGHRVLRAIQAIEDELPKEWITDFPVAADVMLAFAIDEVELIAFVVAADIEIFAKLESLTAGFVRLVTLIRTRFETRGPNEKYSWLSFGVGSNSVDHVIPPLREISIRTSPVTLLLVQFRLWRMLRGTLSLPL